MEKVKLEDLIPEESTIKLGGKEYDLRKINVQDEVWLRNRYGERTKTLFIGNDMEPICALAFRLLKDKKDFVALEEDGYDDNGFPKKILVTGEDRVMRAISGDKEKSEAMWSVFKVFGISRPLPSDEVAADPK